LNFSSITLKKSKEKPREANILLREIMNSKVICLPNFVEKEDEVALACRKMKKIKNQINMMRKQLRLSYDVDRITQIENDQRLKLKKLYKMQKENEKLKKNKNKHKRELDAFNSEGDWDAKRDVLVNELKEGKTTARNNYYANLEKKKELINKHENVVLLDKKIRKMQKLLEIKRKESPMSARVSEVDPENKHMDNLGEKVKEATKAMEFEEKKTQIELHRQESEISHKEHELEITALKLREKKQEHRL